MTENKGLNTKIGNIQKDIESLVKDEKNKKLSNIIKTIIKNVHDAVI